jgi:hypothetical protein
LGWFLVPSLADLFPCIFSMEHNPPLLTLYPGQDPLHTFLGYTPGRQIVSVSARDPYDGREMPPNGNAALSVYTLRGVRKVMFL